MFFGPFLPIVPIVLLLEYLPQPIGEPIQAAIIGVAYHVIKAVSGIIAFIF